MNEIEFDKKKVLIYMRQNILTRKQFADKAELTYQIIAQLFTHNHNPVLSTAYKISKAMNIPLDSLIIDNRNIIENRQPPKRTIQTP